MRASEQTARSAPKVDESRFIQQTCDTLLFPFIELMRREIPFSRGVLSAIRPHGAPPPRFEPGPFSPFAIAARFTDGSGDGDLPAPEILSLIHTTGGFALNMLLVAHRQARFYRYGLVLEADELLNEDRVRGAWQAALAPGRLDRLIVESEPDLRAIEQALPGTLVFEAYRTLTAERYVKLYFRNRY